MKNKLLILILIGVIFSGCVGVSSKGLFGTGVSVALDPRTLGTQIDDSIMQKSLTARILAKDKKYFLLVKSKLLPVHTIAPKTNFQNPKFVFCLFMDKRTPKQL